MDCRTIAVIAVVILLSFPSMTRADSPYEGQTLTGIKVAWMSSGTVEIDNVEGDSKSSFGAGIFFDFPYGPSVTYGFALDVLRMDWEVATEPEALDEARTMLDLSLNFKATLAGGENARWLFRPGVAVGFGALQRFQRLSGSNYLTLKAMGELHYLTAGNFNFVLDATFWHAPSGGDRDRDVKVGPLLLVRFGIVF